MIAFDEYQVAPGYMGAVEFVKTYFICNLNIPIDFCRLFTIYMLLFYRNQEFMVILNMIQTA